MFDIDDLLIYHPNIILTSDVYDILDNMHKYLCNWTFNFRKVVQQPHLKPVAALPCEN